MASNLVNGAIQLIFIIKIKYAILFNYTVRGAAVYLTKYVPRE